MFDKALQGEKCLFISMNHASRNEVAKKWGNYFASLYRSKFINPSFLTPNEVRNTFIDATYVFIDEYLCYREHKQEELYNTLKYSNASIIIKTTPRKFINEDLYELISQLKKENNITFALDRILHPDLIEEAAYLMNNFITDPRTTVFSSYEDQRRKMMDNNTFELEILGKLFK